MMDPNAFQRFHEHADHPIGWMILMLVLLALVVLAAFYLGRRYSHALPAVHVPSGGAPAALDPLTLLRLRYARGEVGREEFLLAQEDLGGPPAPAGPA